MNFTLELTAWTYLLGGAVSWSAKYYDLEGWGIVDGGWKLIDEPVQFNNVSPNGYIAVSLYDGTTQTDWIFSSIFPWNKPQDGELWQFRLYYHGEQGDLVLAPVSVPGWVLVDKVAFTLIKAGTAVTGWVLVDKVAFTLAKVGKTVEGWVLVDKVAFTLTRAGGLPPPPPEEGGVPWIPIAIGAGAAVAIGAAIAGSKKRAKRG